eukprot:6212583-Pleurochrysis_carterae.AAC.2
MSTPMMSSCSRIAFVGVCSRGWRRANTAGARPSSAIPSSWYESSISSAQKRPQLPSVAETSTHMASQWPPTSPATCVIEPSCQQRQSGSTAAAAPSVSKYPSIMITTASPSARGSVRCGLPISPAKLRPLLLARLAQQPLQREARTAQAQSNGDDERRHHKQGEEEEALPDDVIRDYIWHDEDDKHPQLDRVLARAARLCEHARPQVAQVLAVVVVVAAAPAAALWRHVEEELLGARVEEDGVERRVDDAREPRPVRLLHAPKVAESRLHPERVAAVVGEGRRELRRHHRLQAGRRGSRAVRARL